MKELIKKTLTFIAVSLILSHSAYSQSSDYVALDEKGQPAFKIDTSDILIPQNFGRVDINFDAKKLLKTLKNTKYFFKKNLGSDSNLNLKGILNVSSDDVLKTIDFMIDITTEDINNGGPVRLKDPDFINENFNVIRWYPYNPKNKSYKENIRITKYAIFKQFGSRFKTSKYNVPLYGLVNGYEYHDFYKNYTKQQVLSGIFENGGSEYGKADPLVYLTRTGLEEALMQGTISVSYKDGSIDYFNVDRNNGIAYDRNLKPRSQKRFWYFKKVNSIRGYGSDSENKVDIETGVTFAGDIKNIGLGKIVLIKYPSSNKTKAILGVIADTGGAFVPNLFQLDFLAGVYNSRKEYNNSVKALPSYAKAYFLLKK